MYTNLLPKIKNAEGAGKKTLTSIFSKADFSVAKILADNGYIKDVQKKPLHKKSFLEVKLAAKNTISGIKFISKPSRRMYVGWKEIGRVKNGYGLSVFSTSRGMMSGKDARKNKIGGEYLFEIW
ncbi:MAG: 30S ribosomal protein S8 [bacterium]|nr:30S ribosomal protein S8 [bacterium]